MTQKTIILALSLVPVFSMCSRADIVGILVPAYANPAYSPDGPDMWDSLFDTARDTNRRFAIRAVVNPDDGPGRDATFQQTRFDQYFGTAGNGPASQFRNSGGEAVGYVWTDRGNRSISQVLSDIDVYMTGVYAGNIDGIFLDDFYDDPSDLPFYQQVYNHVQTNYAGTFIIGNAGDVGQLNALSEVDLAALISPLDTLVSHEMPPLNPDPLHSDYRNKYTALTYSNQYADSKFAHLVHDAGATWDDSLLDLARSRDAGWFYTTPDSGANPWDNFDPAFWSDFAASVNAVPEPSSTSFAFVVGSILMLRRRRRTSRTGVRW